jgi:predicted dehydrogenase
MAARQPVHAALVGTGGIARAHVEAVQACAGRVQLVAGADVDRARCEAFCARHGIAHAYGDVEEMLATERPDLVMICTPPAFHVDLSLRCL